MNKIVFVDLDDTAADFQGAEEFLDIKVVQNHHVYRMFEPGFFRKLQPVSGALQGVRALICMDYNVQILTQPVAESPHSYIEKVQWIGMHMPELINKIVMTQDKSLLSAPGRYLIDDNEKKWKDKFEANGGKFVHYNYHRNDKQRSKDEWDRIVSFFKLQKELEDSDGSTST